MGAYIHLQLSFTVPNALPLIINPLKFAIAPIPYPTGYCHQLNGKNSGFNSTTGRVRINLEDELYTDPDDEFDEFDFGGNTKQRVWWSDNDFDDEDEDDVESESWVFKVIRAFGWMVPAIGISLLLGTGPNAFLMALAVPLGQTALSVVIDKVWGGAGRRPRPGPRTRTKNRKKPFVRPANREHPSKPKDENKTREDNRSYQTWMAANGNSFNKRDKKVHRFGGWDELDNTQKFSQGTAKRRANNPRKQQTVGKLSRARKVRERPLVVRLLIAVFPFLGSWTRFLF